MIQVALRMDYSNTRGRGICKLLDEFRCPLTAILRNLSLFPLDIGMSSTLEDLAGSLEVWRRCILESS